MKAVFIVHNMAIDDEVTAALSELGAESYTKFRKILGKGNASGPHLDTPIWPEANNGMLVITDSDKASEIMQKIREMRQEYAKEGLKAFVWPVEDATG